MLCAINSDLHSLLRCVGSDWPYAPRDGPGTNSGAVSSTSTDEYGSKVTRSEPNCMLCATVYRAPRAAVVIGDHKFARVSLQPVTSLEGTLCARPALKDG